MPSLTEFLIIAALLFGLGIAGLILNRKNIIVLLMSIELILLAVNTNFIAFLFSRQFDGTSICIFVLTVAASEAAIGLAILVVLYRKRRTIEVQDLDILKG